jgi:UDP-N-acetylglucosamine 4,6-dehydratase
LNYSKEINGKNILITGGTGSFGNQMIEELSNYKPKSVVIYSRDEDKQHNMKENLKDRRIFKNLKFVIGDVRDYDRLFAATKNMDIVFHAAALKQVPTVESHPYEAVKTNVIGAYNMMSVAVARKVKHVVAISTDKAVKPVNAMGITKALQEKIILSEDITKDGTVFCCVRYGNVLGSRGSVVPLWDIKLEKNQPLPITHPEMTRFILTLHEAIQLVFYSLKHAKGGEIFVKKAPSVKIEELAKMYAELKSKKKNYPVEYIGIRSGEKIHEVLVSQEEKRHMTEEKDHFVIHKENEFNKKSIKKSDSLQEYSSDTVKHLNKIQLEKLMKNLKWIN